MPCNTQHSENTEEFKFRERESERETNKMRI